MLLIEFKISPASKKMLNRLYPAEPEGHWRNNEHHPGWRASRVPTSRRTPPEGHYLFSAGTETPSRTHYLPHRLRLRHGAPCRRGRDRDDPGGRFACPNHSWL